MIALASVTAYGQNTSGGAAGSGGTGSGANTTDLPSGLQNRQQLPPGLQGTPPNPPGAVGRTATNLGSGRLGGGVLGSGRLGAGTLGGAPTASEAAGPGAPVGSGSIEQPAVGAIESTTNAFGAAIRSGSIEQPTVGATSGTNQTLTPTSENRQTNRVYGTNTVGRTNSATSRMVRDQAYTAQDQQLLVQVRRTVTPALRSSTSAGGIMNGWLPVSFIINDKVVTLVGIVPSQDVSQRIETSVQQVAGVERVVNQLRVEETAVGGSSTIETDSTSRLGVNTPRTLQSGGAYWSTNTFSSTNTFGLRTGTPAANSSGLTPTSHTNEPSRIYGTSTNQAQLGGTTNLSPTSDRGNTSSQYQNLPPGLRHREELPPGLQKREELPPGLEKRRDGTNE